MGYNSTGDFGVCKLAYGFVGDHYERCSRFLTRSRMMELTSPLGAGKLRCKRSVEQKIMNRITVPPVHKKLEVDLTIEVDFYRATDISFPKIVQGSLSNADATMTHYFRVPRLLAPLRH